MESPEDGFDGNSKMIGRSANAPLTQFNTAADFWSEMVVPDCADYRDDPTDLRRALHAANSLFHMHDWIFHSHENAVRSGFTFTDRNGTVHPVSKPSEFATALEQQNADFGRIRGIANAGKHLQLLDIRPVANAPSHAANVALQTIHGQGAYGQGNSGYGVRGAYGGRPRIMLAGPNGNDMEFSTILESVFKMWETLKTAHGW